MGNETCFRIREHENNDTSHIVHLLLKYNYATRNQTIARSLCAFTPASLEYLFKQIYLSDFNHLVSYCYCLFVVRKCHRRVRKLFRFSSVKQKTKRISSLENKMYNMWRNDNMHWWGLSWAKWPTSKLYNQKISCQSFHPWKIDSPVKGGTKHSRDQWSSLNWCMHANPFFFQYEHSVLSS